MNVTEKAEKEASLYLEKYQKKIQALSERFALGQINQKQFDALYSHYQKNIENVQKTLKESPGTEDWKKAISEGHSILIQRAHQARMVGYILFSLDGQVIRQSGSMVLKVADIWKKVKENQPQSEKTPDVSVITFEISSHWGCLIYGLLTQGLVMLFNEPAPVQLQRMREIHTTFENANRNILRSGNYHQEALVFPQEFFLNKSF